MKHLSQTTSQNVLLPRCVAAAVLERRRHRRREAITVHLERRSGRREMSTDYHTVEVVQRNRSLDVLGRNSRPWLKLKTASGKTRL